jgi:hypothetical protein
MVEIITFTPVFKKPLKGPRKTEHKQLFLLKKTLAEKGWLRNSGINNKRSTFSFLAF